MGPRCEVRATVAARDEEAAPQQRLVDEIVPVASRVHQPLEHEVSHAGLAGARRTGSNGCLPPIHVGSLCDADALRLRAQAFEGAGCADAAAAAYVQAAAMQLGEAPHQARHDIEAALRLDPANKEALAIQYLAAMNEQELRLQLLGRIRETEAALNRMASKRLALVRGSQLGRETLAVYRHLRSKRVTENEAEVSTAELVKHGVELDIVLAEWRRLLGSAR